MLLVRKYQSTTRIVRNRSFFIHLSIEVEESATRLELATKHNEKERGISHAVEEEVIKLIPSIPDNV